MCRQESSQRYTKCRNQLCLFHSQLISPSLNTQTDTDRLTDAQLCVLDVILPRTISAYISCGSVNIFFCVFRKKNTCHVLGLCRVHLQHVDACAATIFYIIGYMTDLLLVLKELPCVTCKPVCSPSSSTESSVERAACRYTLSMEQ